MTEEMKNAIEAYKEAQASGNDTEDAMHDLTLDMFFALKLNDREYSLTDENGTVWTDDAKETARLIYWNYSDSEWIEFMLSATAEHGRYELNPYGNTIISIEW